MVYMYNTLSLGLVNHQQSRFKFKIHVGEICLFKHLSGE